MNQNEALNLLVQAVNMAQQKGVYSLKEAALLADAVETFQPPQTQPETVAVEEMAGEEEN